MSANKEIKFLTGIRGVAVLLVLFAHMLPGHSFNRSIAYLGMSLFFMLSGTVLTYIWGNRFFLVNTDVLNFIPTFVSFIWARFARLAPLYLLVAIPYFASSGRPWEEVSALIPRYLLGIQSWTYDVASYGSIKQLLVYAMSWSISSELCLYFMFPGTLLFLLNRMKRMRWTILLGVYFAYCTTLVLLTKNGIYTGPGYPPSQTWVDWFVYLSPYGRFLEFTFGMLVGFTLLESSNNSDSKKKLSYHGVFAILLIAGTIKYLSIEEANNTTSSALALLRMGPLFTLPICYLMLALARGNDITHKLFSNLPLVTIGKWSYSIYLLEGYGLPLFGQFWTPGISQTIMYVTNFFVILLLAAGSYEVIESPARKFLLQYDPGKKLSILIEKLTQVVFKKEEAQKSEI